MPDPTIVIFGTILPTEEGYYFIRAKATSLIAFVYVHKEENLQVPPNLTACTDTMKLEKVHLADCLFSSRIQFI